MNLLWLLVGVLVVAWLLGVSGVIHLAATLIWAMLLIAVIIAVVVFSTEGYLE